MPCLFSPSGTPIPSNTEPKPACSGHGGGACPQVGIQPPVFGFFLRAEGGAVEPFAAVFGVGEFGNHMVAQPMGLGDISHGQLFFILPNVFIISAQRVGQVAAIQIELLALYSETGKMSHA